MPSDCNPEYTNRLARLIASWFMAIKAIVLLATLKKHELSNTETLCDFLLYRMVERDIECDMVKLVDCRILPGTYTNMGDGDEWPGILDKILASDIIIFATPIWWGGHSSEIQRAIERLDGLHDEILAGKPSRLEGKVGGIVTTGDSDGAQHVIASLANFFNAIGLTLPPYATLSVLHEKQKKGATTTREELLKVYEKDYAKAADTMVDGLIKYTG